MNYTYTIGGIKVTLIDNESKQAHPVDEAMEYVKEAFEARPEYKPHTKELVITIGETAAVVDYRLDTPKFQRIRRITGYLVGDLSKFNDGKRAEEHDRIPHTFSYTPKPTSGLLEEE